MPVSLAAELDFTIMSNLHEEAIGDIEALTQVWVVVGCGDMQCLQEDVDRVHAERVEQAEWERFKVAVVRL